ncbi:MAG: hypothetical protein U0271_11950 [Polyangiaceae bacterium]
MHKAYLLAAAAHFAAGSALAGCSGSPDAGLNHAQVTAKPSATASSSASASAVPVDKVRPAAPKTLVLEGGDRPSDFKEDGAIEEWEQFGSAADVPDGVVSLTHDGLVLAGRVAGAAKNGVWFTLDFVAPELPPIGFYQRYGGVAAFDEDCERNPYTGEEWLADERGHCVEAMARYSEFRDSWNAMFVATYRIDDKGVRLFDGSRLVSMNGASGTFKSNGADATFEVVIPAAALPHASYAPIDAAVSTMELAKSDDPPDMVRDATWSNLSFTPAYYGRLSELREIQLQQWYSMYGRSVAYQPGDDKVWTEASWDPAYSGEALMLAEHPVFETRAKVSDEVEVGIGYSGMPSLVVLREGLPPYVMPVTTAPTVFKKRGPQLHAFSYHQEEIPDAGIMIPAWEVYTIDANGEVGGGPLEMAPTNGFLSASEFHNKDYTSFGYSGMVMNYDGPPTKMTVTYRYDKTENWYPMTVK